MLVETLLQNSREQTNKSPPLWSFVQNLCPGLQPRRFQSFKTLPAAICFVMFAKLPPLPAFKIFSFGFKMSSRVLFSKVFNCRPKSQFPKLFSNFQNLKLRKRFNNGQPRSFLKHKIKNSKNIFKFQFVFQNPAATLHGSRSDFAPQAM